MLEVVLVAQFVEDAPGLRLLVERIEYYIVGKIEAREEGFVRIDDDGPVASPQEGFDDLRDPDRLPGSGRPGHQQMQRFQPRRNGRAGDQDLCLARLAGQFLQASLADHAGTAQEALEPRAAEL